MKTALVASVLVLAAALAAFNAWQVAVPPPGEPRAPAAARAAPAPETDTTSSWLAAERAGWSPPAARDKHEGPLPDGLMRGGTASVIPEREETRPAPSRPSRDDSVETSRSDAPAHSARHPLGAAPDTGRTLELPTVSAILWNETRPLAVIDGDVVSEGETVGKLKVERIDKRAVRCSGPPGWGKTIVLRLSPRGRGRTP